MPHTGLHKLQRTTQCTAHRTHLPQRYTAQNPTRMYTLLQRYYKQTQLQHDLVNSNKSWWRPRSEHCTLIMAEVSVLPLADLAVVEANADGQLTIVIPHDYRDAHWYTVTLNLVIREDDSWQMQVVQMNQLFSMDEVEKLTVNDQRLTGSYLHAAFGEGELLLLQHYTDPDITILHLLSLHTKSSKTKRVTDGNHLIRCIELSTADDGSECVYTMCDGGLLCELNGANLAEMDRHRLENIQQPTKIQLSATYIAVMDCADSKLKIFSRSSFSIIWEVSDIRVSPDSFVLTLQEELIYQTLSESDIKYLNLNSPSSGVLLPHSLYSALSTSNRTDQWTHVLSFHRTKLGQVFVEEWPLITSRTYVYPLEFLYDDYEEDVRHSHYLEADSSQYLQTISIP